MTVVIFRRHPKLDVAMLDVLKVFDLADVSIEIPRSSKGHSQVYVLHVRIEHEKVS